MTLLDALAGDETVADWFSDAAELASLLRFEHALAEAEAECGLIPASVAPAISAVCAGFTPDWPALRQGMARDGVVVPALVKALRAGLAPEHREWLHWQATSQDAVDTGLVLRLVPVAAELERRLAGVIDQLRTLTREQGERALMAHTRMQRALPITAADKLNAWLRPLERQRARLAALRAEVLVVQLGGPVGTRAGFAGHGEAVAAALARRLDLAYGPCWHTGRDGLVGFGQWLALLAGALGKIGQDVALLAQNEVGAVRLAGGGSSSAMPHKSNPVAAEVLVALARHAAGLSGTLAQALVHEGERSGAAWTLEWLTLPPLAIATAAALRHAGDLLAGLTFAAPAT